MSILAMVMVGVLTSLIQTRRTTQANIAHSTAFTIAQGYIEQIKNIPLQTFVNASPSDTQNTPNLSVSYVLPTLKDQSSTVIQLSTTPSSVAASTLTGATPGVTPSGVVDNLQSFDMDSQSTSSTVTWTTAWPGANTTLTPYPSTTPGLTDLRMNFWVKITDLTPSASPMCKCYGILLVYAWQYIDGVKIKYQMDTVSTMRSAVQTF